MALWLERVFSRVLRRLPASDTFALASQKEKVIRSLYRELLAEGILVAEEGGASISEGSAPRQRVVASPQNDLNVSAEEEVPTAGYSTITCTHACISVSGSIAFPTL